MTGSAWLRWADIQKILTVRGNRTRVRSIKFCRTASRSMSTAMKHGSRSGTGHSGRVSGRRSKRSSTAAFTRMVLRGAGVLDVLMNRWSRTAASRVCARHALRNVFSFGLNVAFPRFFSRFRTGLSPGPSRNCSGLTSDMTVPFSANSHGVHSWRSGTTIERSWMRMILYPAP